MRSSTSFLYDPCRTWEACVRWSCTCFRSEDWGCQATHQVCLKFPDEAKVGRRIYLNFCLWSLSTYKLSVQWLEYFTESKTLWRQWKKLCVKGEMLYRRFDIDTQSHIWQLVVPESKRSAVLHAYHDVPTAGHIGIDKSILRQTLYWPDMTELIRNYCYKCGLCTACNLSKS